MAVRTTVAAVQAIMDTDLTDPQILAFITDASLWIDTFLEGACDDLTDSLLATIEKYLAAALITARDARLKSAKWQDVAETYQRGGEVSEYLRAAIALDPCGIVAEKFLDQEDRKKARFRVGEGFDPNLDLPTD